MQKSKITFASINISATDEDGNSVTYALNKNIRTLTEVREFLDKVEQKLTEENEVVPTDNDK